MPTIVSSGIYAAMGLLFLVAIPWEAHAADQPAASAFIVVGIVLALVCFYMCYAVSRALEGTKVQRKRFVIAAAVFCGVMAFLGGRWMGLVAGVPLLVALLGMREPPVDA